MTLHEYEAKTFSERPDAKAEYDALAPQYEAATIIRRFLFCKKWQKA